MKTALTTLLSLALACVASACNFASLNDTKSVSKAESLSRQHGRTNEGAFRPISSAPGRRSGG